MTSKKKSSQSSEITWHLQEEGTLPVNPQIRFWRYFQFGKRTKFEPGDKFKAKGERGAFTFDRFCRNEDTGSEWVDCFDTNKNRRSLKAEKIKGKVKS